MERKTFVLVHGFTQSPSGWDRLQPHLENDAHEVLLADLRMDDLAEAGGVECAEVIAETAERAQFPVHLVGTSGSGALIPLVPEFGDIERMVFISAGLPDVGRSLVEQINEDGVLTDEWMAEPDTSSSSVVSAFMFNDCDEETRAWGLTTVRTFNPPKLYEEVTPLKRWPDVPSIYILGARDRIIRSDWSRSVVPERLGTRPVEVDSGHCPQVSMPQRLAEILLQSAAIG